MPAVIDDARLAQVRPFAGLTVAERKMIGRAIDPFTAPTGTTLVEQGRFGYEFMIIEEGTVDVVRDGKLVDSMGPGDFFGELAVLAAGGERNASIVATSPVRGLRLTAHDMRVLRERIPSLGAQIDSVAAARSQG